MFVRKETSTAPGRSDGPERNLGVFPQEAEPEAGSGGA